MPVAGPPQGNQSPPFAVHLPTFAALCRYDGVGSVELCPVLPGQKMTYRFQVNEMPGASAAPVAACLALWAGAGRRAFADGAPAWLTAWRCSTCLIASCNRRLAVCGWPEGRLAAGVGGQLPLAG